MAANLALSFISDNGEQLCASCYLKQYYNTDEHKPLPIKTVNGSDSCQCGLAYKCEENIAAAFELLVLASL